MPARILAAHDDPNVLRSIVGTLRSEGHDVLSATTGSDAVRTWAAEAPDLVILAAALPGTDGFAFAERIRKEEAEPTHLPILIVSADGGVTEKVKALRAGADDVLVTPFHPQELVARTKGLLAKFAPVAAGTMAPPIGRISAFYGAKGGVGTTTLAVNSAIALHRELGRRTVLVDGNLQFGDHHVFLDLGLDRKGIVDVVTAPQIDQHLIESVLFHHDAGIDVLLGPSSPEMAELVKTEHLPEILTILQENADHIVVDLDRRLDETNLRILDVADRIYVVMTADLSCLKNVRLLIETIGHLGYEESKVELVLNRSTAMTGIGAKNVESVLGRPIGRQVVNDYRAAITALNRGNPFMVGAPNSAIGRSIVDFAKGIDNGHTPLPAPKLLTSVAGAAAFR